MRVGWAYPLGRHGDKGKWEKRVVALGVGH